MLNCKQASILVSQSLDRRLNWRERLALRVHLWICVYCRRFASQLKWLRKQLIVWQQTSLSQTETLLSSQARQRIIQTLDGADQNSPT